MGRTGGGPAFGMGEALGTGLCWARKVGRLEYWAAPSGGMLA